MFVVDALDECTSEPELTDLILSLAQALHDPGLPVTHILLTSCLETHISEAFQNEEVCLLLCEIPVKTSGEGVATIILLNGTDVNTDIYVFLWHSFAKLTSHHPNFPQPMRDELMQLASHAGRHFIMASIMVKFIIDSEDKDPCDQLQLMLELMSELLAGMEVYKLYNHILSTCADPKWAYLHLSIVAALADPLPISQILSLLGPDIDPIIFPRFPDLFPDPISNSFLDPLSCPPYAHSIQQDIQTLPPLGFWTTSTTSHISVLFPPYLLDPQISGPPDINCTISGPIPTLYPRSCTYPHLGISAFPVLGYLCFRLAD
ncbi:uncharacterized protein BJ212DRAFT_1483948 [Suillus subaureus]|uniref:NACHT domain-containing protein n=1 Tax=Suillus subaureus TaxID=48587 RepID=A0A9P7JAQ0_9AGAM|nr:uncharacterized protein BJ212DRAFT_1483948 [Suillus subaureus]KAG1811295.1 hypothetical protein BJ212DRAFT_1483948 [Suillus subaureus]